MTEPRSVTPDARELEGHAESSSQAARPVVGYSGPGVAAGSAGRCPGLRVVGLVTVNHSPAARDSVTPNLKCHAGNLLDPAQGRGASCRAAT